ncbi:hypothetical protein M407DRAFT_12632, partial [Tulasnella calospora MUT 4182]
QEQQASLFAQPTGYGSNNSLALAAGTAQINSPQPPTPSFGAQSPSPGFGAQSSSSAFGARSTSPAFRDVAFEIEGRIARMRELSPALLQSLEIPEVYEAVEDDEADEAAAGFETQVVGGSSSAVNVGELEG